jgi:hypothetical protein
VLKRATHQRVVAWLALAAMALIVLMPVMSRSMSMPMMSDVAMAGMDPGCPMAAGHASHHHHHGTPCTPDDPTAKCAYCIMLVHTPVAGLGSAPLLATLHLPALAPQSISHRTEPFAPILSARPRGPPSFANV